MVDAEALALPFGGTECLPPPGLVSAVFTNLRAMPESVLTERAEPGATHEDLVLAIARGRSRGAFARLFSHFAPRLKAYLKRQGVDGGQAEELVQEVMLLVWNRAETFDPAQASANTWIFTIARNKRIDAIRRERRPEYDPSDPALVADPSDPADRVLEARQETARLQAAIGALPQEQAELLRLAYFDDKSHSVISVERGIPLGTVKSRLRLALDRLRRMLREPA